MDWMTNPAEDFVRILSADLLGNRRFTPTVKDQFTAITKRAFEQLVGERINERLKGAMTSESKPILEATAPIVQIESLVESQILTTEEETEGFHIVRAILRGLVSPRQVVMRDAQSYCAILLDDNNRKPICRLRFNNTEKLSLGIFNENKEEDRFSLESIDDIYNYSDQLKATLKSYLPTEGS
jgi:hypothetical protein